MLAMLDFNLTLTELPPSFRVRVPTSWGVPDDVSGCQLGNSDFREQMECTITTMLP